MTIQYINTSNTFYQWTILTQKLVQEVNKKFVLFTENPLYSNTNISVKHDVVTDNIFVNGDITLDGLAEITLDVFSNAIVQGSIYTSNAIFYSLTTNNNLSLVNLTTNYLNNFNTVETANLNVASNIIFSNTLNLNSIDVTTGTANIYSLTGNSYINIINTINSSNAYVFAQDNISSFITFAIGLG